MKTFKQTSTTRYLFSSPKYQFLGSFWLRLSHFHAQNESHILCCDANVTIVIWQEVRGRGPKFFKWLNINIVLKSEMHPQCGQLKYFKTWKKKHKKHTN